MADGFREVSLSRGGKLVVMRRGEEWFLRLRLWTDGDWTFATPPLPLAREHVEWLDQTEVEDTGYPLDFDHSALDGKLNLLLFRGKVHVHLHGRQYVGAASDLRNAFDDLDE